MITTDNAHEKTRRINAAGLVVCCILWCPLMRFGELALTNHPGALKDDDRMSNRLLSCQAAAIASQFSAPFSQGVRIAVNPVTVNPSKLSFTMAIT